MTYAGPLPESPVTASSSPSSRRTTLPTASKSDVAARRSFSVACVPAEIAVAPASARAATLGIVRTTREPGGSRASRAAMGTPAAMETTSWSFRTSGPMTVSTLSTTCGFTERTITDDARTSSWLSVVTRILYRSASCLSRSLFTSLATIDEGLTSFDWMRPRISAPAMFPAPRKPMVSAGFLVAVFLRAVTSSPWRGPRAPSPWPRGRRTSSR